MKPTCILIAIAITVLLSNCSTTRKFPVSTTAPAAVLSVKKSRDNQKNFTVEITANYLASADRLTPPGENYSVWIVTKERSVKNIGQLVVRNAKKSTLKTSTPYDFEEVFITVEQKRDSEYPSGTEITRVKI